MPQARETEAKNVAVTRGLLAKAIELAARKVVAASLLRRLARREPADTIG